MLLLSFCLIALAWCSISQATLTPNDFCVNHFNTSAKEFYTDPADCHWYYHCHFINSTWATGTRLQCDAGKYFSDRLMQCVVESQPCTDYCANDTIAAAGCYGGDAETGCATYFRCANSISHQFCCSPGTSFQLSTCSCVWDATCKDSCNATSTTTPRTVATTMSLPAPSNDGLKCNDSRGNILQKVAGKPWQFISINLANPSKPRTVLFDCAKGAWFSLETCDCSLFAGTNTSMKDEPQQCLVYMPFDNDWLDHSINGYTVELSQGNLTINNTFAAIGQGAVHLWNGGQLDIAGLKNFDFQDKGSWCFFFSSDANGRILHNGPKATFYMESLATSLDINLGLINPEGLFHLSTPISGWGYHQICATLHNSSISLYLDNVLKITRILPQGTLGLSFQPFSIGSGNFTGFVDEVLICRHALTPADIDAHYRGDKAFLAANGLIPSLFSLTSNYRK